LTANIDAFSFCVGLTWIDAEISSVNDNNGPDRVLDGYNSFNLFANYFLTDNLSLRFAVNNLTDEIGITEAEGGQSVVNGRGITGARSITGRSSTLALGYEF
jgi:outer membrane receptor protein involved in Fe transport